MDVNQAIYRLHLLKIHFSIRETRFVVKLDYKFANRSNWTRTKYSVKCMKHFEDKFIFHGKGKRKKLKLSLNPVLTIHSKATLEKPSTIPTTSTKRKPPKEKTFQEDEASKFMKADTILSFDELDANYCPSGFQIFKTDIYIFYYNFVYNENTEFPSIKEGIKIDSELHI